MTIRARAVQFPEAGGPQVLGVVNIELGDPGPGEVLVRQRAIGVNYMDVYHRSGLYPLPLPSGVGMEAAGIVERAGAGVAQFKAGDRVCYGSGAPGAYADLRIMPADRLIGVPDGVIDEIAAAILLKGMTAEYLLNRCYPLKSGEFALVYAAAGGVGLLAGQWGRHLGARMIGVASGPDKCRRALDAGYFAVIDRSREDVLARVKEITGGAGVPVVYDSVGKATFDTSIKCLAPRGYFVSFGTTTGAPPPVDAALLQKSGSLYFTRPTLVHYCSARPDMLASAQAVFDLYRKGILKPQIGQRYPLAEAARAHEDLEAGRTTGSSLLLP